VVGGSEQFGTDTSRLAGACSPMRIADWYVHKAKQCIRMAGETTEALVRIALHEEAELWRGIARDVNRQDRDEIRRRSERSAPS
jgi:hypothetical protein